MIINSQNKNLWNLGMKVVIILETYNIFLPWKIETSYPNRHSNSAKKKKKVKNVVIHKRKDLNSLHFCNKYDIDGYSNVCTVIFI